MKNSYIVRCGVRQAYGTLFPILFLMKVRKAWDYEELVPRAQIAPTA